MPDLSEHYDLLRALVVVLGVAALTSFLFRLVRQPIVLGYIAAGLVIGPHVPIPLVADPAVVHTLSELGVILLMFFLGLEFSLGKLFRVGPSVAVTAIVQSSLLLWMGFAVASLFGWTMRESLFTGAIIAISSTTIIAKAFEEQGVAGRLRELVIGVLIVEDLIAIVLMALLTAIATGAGLSPVALARTGASLGAFLVVLVGGGLLVVPRLLRALARANRAEMMVVTTMALCFGAALLAREFGYSVALGAFLAGSLVAESGEERKIEQLVQPLRDVFGAVFFVSVGMMIDPALIVRHWSPILVLTIVVVVGKIVSVSFGAFLTGNGVRTSIQTGMSLAQIGEFSFIIAGLGISLGATRDFLFPIAVAVSSLTTLLTPWLIRISGQLASWVDRKLPRPLQTFGSLYGSWLERINSSQGRTPTAVAVRRLVRMLVVDSSALAAVVISAALGADTIRSYLVDHLKLAPPIAGALLAVGAAVLSAPFCVGILRLSRKLGSTLAETALLRSSSDGVVDLAAAPRRALAITLQLGLMMLVGVPIVAITQPFLRSFHGGEILLLGAIILGVAVWRTATNLHGHVRAGAEVIVEALARQTKSAPDVEAPVSLAALFVGLGEPVVVELTPDSFAVGKTLATLNVRGDTGATVLAITRADSAIVVPSSREVLRAGDRLALAGTRDGVVAARVLLTGGPQRDESATT